MKTQSYYLDTPVFVVGVDRSGTTLLNMMLDSHPDMFITYEQRTIINFYEKLSYYGDLTVEENSIRLINDILNDANVKLNFPTATLANFNVKECNSFAHIIKSLYSVVLKNNNKLIWGDKDPIYTEHIETLHEIFPDAKFIHLVRDGRDVALSLMTKTWGPNTFSSAIKFWEKNVQITRRLLKMLDSAQTIELKYEYLVQSPEENLQQLCSFLQLEYSEKMLNSYSEKALDNNQIKARISGVHKNILDRPNVTHTYKWKKTLSPVDQAIAWEYAGDELKHFRYEHGVTRHPFKVIRKAYFFLKEAYTYRLK
ncbi:MAG: hypothetical protein ACI9AT_000058 [Ulvibacter sp.]